MPAKLKGESYPPKSGFIVTQKVASTGKRAWRVDISAKRTGLKREQRQFSRKEDAYGYAENRWREIQEVGRQAFALSAAQRSDAAKALALLTGTGLTLFEAAEMAVKYSKPLCARLSITELRKGFLSQPGRRGRKLIERRARTIKDLKLRTAVFEQLYGGKFTDEINADTIKAWLASMCNLGPLSRNNYRRAIHAMFAYAVTEGHCTTNPVAIVSSYAVAAVTPSILSIGDAERLINAAATHDCDFGLLAFVALGLFAGLRRAELERLDWSAVKFDRAMVTIDATIAKTGSMRNVALSPNVVAWLGQCAIKSGRLAPCNLAQRLRRLRFLAGIDKWEGNELRHSFASYHYDLHQNGPLTSAQLGHSSGCQLLFEHYRSLVPLGDGRRFFDIIPKGANPSLQLA